VALPTAVGKSGFLRSIYSPRSSHRESSCFYQETTSSSISVPCIRGVGAAFDEESTNGDESKDEKKGNLSGIPHFPVSDQHGGGCSCGGSPSHLIGSSTLC
jgi:hypothetical protein